MQFKWLEWAGKIQSVAQKGLLYSKNPYQIEDYQLFRLQYCVIIDNLQFD
ncbi:MAG: NUDIX hydrolase N-terminal domain-containing protein, partial [Cyanobacteria bacterium J06636_27]